MIWRKKSWDWHSRFSFITIHVFVVQNFLGIYGLNCFAEASFFISNKYYSFISTNGNFSSWKFQLMIALMIAKNTKQRLFFKCAYSNGIFFSFKLQSISWASNRSKEKNIASKSDWYPPFWFLSSILVLTIVNQPTEN